MASSAVKLLCRQSGLNEGYEVTEREPMWIYAILSYGPGSHLLLTGVGVEGLTDSRDPERELDGTHSLCGLGAWTTKPIAVSGLRP